MKLSDRGLQLIRNHEGFRAEAYKDAAGVWTIGYGHAQAGPGQKITRERAEEILRADVTRFEAGVTAAVKVPLSQERFDALVSFTFNIGLTAFQNSTLLRKLNAGDYRGAAGEFGRWYRAGGKVMRGLVKRRKAEADLFRAT